MPQFLLPIAMLLFLMDLSKGYQSEDAFSKAKVFFLRSNSYGDCMLFDEDGFVKPR